MEHSIERIFSERFLQMIWNEQYLQSAPILVSGARLDVVTTGIWNVGSGPDFKNASLLIDGRMVSGDIEIHCNSSDWHHHGHGADPAYNNVVLHVVWGNDVPSIREGMETLVLSHCLLDAWEKLLSELETACYPYSRQVGNGGCSLKWAMTSDCQVQRLLRSAGLARFESKGHRYARQAADLGTEQALYELIFDSLGYKSNRENFLKLARGISLARLQSLPGNEEREALLFGAAGFIPDCTRQPILEECLDWTRYLWDAWWSQGMPSVSLQWNLGDTRPFNHPCRRLAAGIAMLNVMEYRPHAWLQRQAQLYPLPKKFLQSLAQLNDKASAWRGRIDFSHRATPPADLLGHARLLDMAANVFLPYLYGVTPPGQSSDRLTALARHAYLLLPKGQENRLEKEAIQRFLTPPSRAGELIQGACHQQGILYIFKNLCLALDHNCSQCPAVQSGEMPSMQ